MRQQLTRCCIVPCIAFAARLAKHCGRQSYCVRRHSLPVNMVMRHMVSHGNSGLSYVIACFTDCGGPVHKPDRS